MVETDWREILSFSQRELGQTDKEKLCESLSWMEADDIELNFSDLKTLFRLAQDILKYKSEQVNNLLGKLEASHTKSKRKTKGSHTESPASTDSILETIAHQEEVIKANKEILKQLYADIAELEGKKNKLERDRNNMEGDSESSRDALSEMNALVQLENENAMKNRHIRKLLTDVKVLEEENTQWKEKVSVLKDKLTEATQLIDNLTEQLLGISNECIHLKEILGKSENTKAQLSSEIESLRRELFEKDSNRENIYEEIKSKVHHWKNIAKTKKAELESLSIENEKLKENLSQTSKQVLSPKIIKQSSEKEDKKIRELQEKLTEASNEIERSANIISLLRAENRQLKSIIEETPDSTVTDIRNESDDGKQRILINKLKRKVKSLTVSLQGAEEMISIREKELAEIASELQLLQSDEGINSLLGGLKHKKRELKVKDEGIKTLVQEINNMSHLVNDLELENETLRQQFNVPVAEKVSTEGVVKKYRALEQNNSAMSKEIRTLENKLVNVEIKNRSMSSQISKMTRLLNSLGYNKTNIEEMVLTSDSDDNMPTDGGGESSVAAKQTQAHQSIQYLQDTINANETEIKKLIEENEGLRKGLQEILDFLKDNSSTSSGILALKCPSLEAVLRSMEARHAAGWFAPHMETIMELRSAMGGKDALLSALHEARKETFDVMSKLSKETKKCSELERKLQEKESQNKQKDTDQPGSASNSYEFGSWISEKDQSNIDINDKNQIQNIIDKGNCIYEKQLRFSLEYFQGKFKALHGTLTSMEIQAADDSNKWSIQEEKYKAQLENLKSQIQQQEDEDISENSPGLIAIPSAINLQRKCSYLEESYKYIRTLNENLKNENMDGKRHMMTMSSEYEMEIQRLILSVVNLTDKLRNSIPVELFWKQNVALNEMVSKYRQVIETYANNKNKQENLLNRLENDKSEVVNRFRKEFSDNAQSGIEKILSRIEESVLKKQLEGLCQELEDKDKIIKHLENINLSSQETQSKIIDDSLASISKEELELIKTQLQIFVTDNKVLKEQYQHTGSQLAIALLQLQENQQKQMSNDMEVNILRHQILDLQSSSDNKAIVARLSGEVLVAHLQASESNKKYERLNSALIKEKELRTEAEEMLKARQKIFEVYSFRYESKFRYMFEVMQVLRHQYQGSIPLVSIENYLNKMEDISRETHALNEKLQEIEDLRSNLMAKHSVFDQILDVSKNKCLIDDESCSHKLKAIMKESIHSRELDHVNKKLQAMEQTREGLIKHCNKLEKTLVLVNQGFEKSALNGLVDRKHSDGENRVSSLELEDIQSDDDSISRKSQTITLPKPQVLKPLKTKSDDKNTENKSGSTKSNEEVIGSPVRTQTFKERTKVSSVQIQTISFEQERKHVSVQTAADREINALKQNVYSLKKENEKQNKELLEALSLIQEKNKETTTLSAEKLNFETSIQNLKTHHNQKDKQIEKLRFDIEELTNELDNIKSMRIAEINKKRDVTHEENKTLLLTLRQLENDKHMIAAEYKQLLNNEREEYSATIKELNLQIMEIQSKLDRKGSDSNGSNAEAFKEVVSKYTVKIVELEDKSFKLQSELDGCKAELITYQSEVERWKDLATERLAKMEQLNSQLEERHCHEVESYKAENQHWLSQLNDSQREHMELRTRLTEQKAMYMKQLAEKDAHTEQMRSVINNLKAQVMNMQTMISVQDPSFDLSAIVEVDESHDAMSHGSDRLEIKFDSSGDFNEDEFGRIGSSSTTIWHEPIIERLRHDKQLVGKQNAMLRRQIKALAARERRSRLDAQNLKNQVFRISTTGNKVATAETAALHNKIACLQAQLTNARRDTHSSIALWDKWKRAQQAADRWQTRFEEKCQEVTKLEASLNLAKSAVSRLDKEKRMLLSRLNEVRGESQLSIEKQESEAPEKAQRSIECANCMDAPPLSNHALLERVQAQQRRIVALTLAEKGNEHLVSEYEKALAEITSLKGQVLKLESTLLESQIRTPIKTDSDTQPELEYWKSYCSMLKEENVQLNLRVSSMESIPTTAHQHRINDLEQTILTLRGLVSKLQAEQKWSLSTTLKRIDSRPSSGRSVTEKGTSRLEPLRVEIVNLKRSMHDKDLLLERSKEMLKIAAEREDELLRENAFLRRQLGEYTKPKEGFLSA